MVQSVDFTDILKEKSISRVPNPGLLKRHPHRLTLEISTKVRDLPPAWCSCACCACRDDASTIYACAFFSFSFVDHLPPLRPAGHPELREELLGSKN